MKKLLYLTTVLLFAFISCTKEDDTTNQCDCDSYKSTGVYEQTQSTSLTSDVYYEDEDIEIVGGLNLNGYTFEVKNGCVTVLGNLNGGGTFISTTYYVTGNIQNNPTITG